MNDGIMLSIDEDGVASMYDDTYDITIHCESKEEQDEAMRRLSQQWVPCSERLPEECEEVNITWVNTNPPDYYADIKGKPFTATGLYCRGRWYWYSVLCRDYLEEYGVSLGDEVDDDIKVIAWRPMPEPYKEEIIMRKD